MRPISISVKNVTKTYKLYSTPKDRLKEAFNFVGKSFHRDHHALHDISFDIPMGETMGIIGENGSGKSTLLKIITGVLTPTSGTVSVNGKISALLELGAGFNPEYTGIENIYFNGMVMGFSKKEMDKKVDSIIDFADIGNFIYQPVKTYSSGMFVRLAYAVAVSIEPDILIIDEALSVGDAFFQMKSMSKMHELFEKGKTVLFVTHDTATVKSLCTKAIYLESGRIVAQGPSKEVVDMYEAKVREKMSLTEANGISDVKTVSSEVFKKSKSIVFKENPSFGYLVKHSREGNGDAIVTEIELLDKEENSITEVKFNQNVKLRFHIKYIRDCEICIGYHIRDNKNIPILGSNTVLEGEGEIQGNANDKIIVDFETKFPLMDGRYNVMSVLSKNVIVNRSAIFVDITQDGFTFIVEENKNGRIWNKVYVDNNIVIKKY